MCSLIYKVRFHCPFWYNYEYMCRYAAMLYFIEKYDIEKMNTYISVPAWFQRNAYYTSHTWEWSHNIYNISVCRYYIGMALTCLLPAVLSVMLATLP